MRHRATRPRPAPTSAAGSLPRALRLVLPVALLLAGCYRYAPLPAPAAPAGAEVRLYLTAEGAARVAPTLGPQTAVVSGRAQGGPGDTARLLVSQTTKTTGGTLAWVGERVAIPLGAVARGERRVLDRRRSFLAGGGAALAAAAGYAILRATAGGGAGAGNDPPVPTP